MHFQSNANTSVQYNGQLDLLACIHNSSSLENYLTLLERIVESTADNTDVRLYIQRDVLCIGPAVATLLAEIYLDALDNNLRNLLCSTDSCGSWIGRYLDEFLCSFSEDLLSRTTDVAFMSSPELVFPFKVPTKSYFKYYRLETVWTMAYDDAIARTLTGAILIHVMYTQNLQKVSG